MVVLATAASADARTTLLVSAVSAKNAHSHTEDLCMTRQICGGCGKAVVVYSCWWCAGPIRPAWNARRMPRPLLELTVHCCVRKPDFLVLELELSELILYYSGNDFSVCCMVSFLVCMQYPTPCSTLLKALTRTCQDSLGNTDERSRVVILNLAIKSITIPSKRWIILSLFKSMESWRNHHWAFLLEFKFIQILKVYVHSSIPRKRQKTREG